MTDKVYEMEDDYKESVAELLKAIKSRDELAESIKLLPPENRCEALRILAEMDKDLDAVEAGLADACAAYQKFRRKEEEVSEISEKLGEQMEIGYIRLKHLLPDKLAEKEASLFHGWTPENIQEFYDRVAIREATQLEKILADNKKP
jgi:DNA-binding transcriptional ArsR family regulator